MITTDGMENASHCYDAKTVKQMIKEKEAAGWEFIFLAANIDAVGTAENLGIRADRAANFVQDGDGFDACYSVMNCAISAVRANKSLDDRAWRKRLDKKEEDET